MHGHPSPGDPRRLIAIGLVLLLAACAQPAATTAPAATGSQPTGAATEDPASGYPEHEITMVIPFPAGGALDVTYRTLAGVAERELGQPIVAVNMEGAAGTVGVSEVATAEPDGYTIGATGSLTVLAQPRVQDVPYSGPQDLTPIMQANAAPTVLAVGGNAEWDSIEDFVEAARANPGQLRVGLPGGANTIADIQANVLMEVAGIEFTKVFVEVGQIVPSLLNETFEAAIAQPAVVRSHTETGEIRMLAQFGEEPIEGLGVPLAVDEGYPVTQIAYEFLYGPPGLPDSIVERLVDAFTIAWESDEFQSYAEDARIQLDLRGPEELAQKLTEDFDNYEQYIQPAQ